MATTGQDVRLHRAMNDFRRDWPAGVRALHAMAAAGDRLLTERTVTTVARGILSGDWRAAAVDARGMLLACERPCVVVLPVWIAGTVEPFPLWTEPWPWGTDQLRTARALRGDLTGYLFGYRTPAAEPPVCARRIRHAPDLERVVDALGRITLDDARAVRPDRPAWLLPAWPAAAPARTEWAALACSLGAEGPLHPQRIHNRIASDQAWWRASALVGLLAGWLCLVAGRWPGRPPGPQVPPAAPSNGADLPVPARAVAEVVALWRTAAGDGEAAWTAAARELLDTGLRLLTSGGPRGYDTFDHWFDARLRGRAEVEAGGSG